MISVVRQPFLQVHQVDELVKKVLRAGKSVEEKVLCCNCAMPDGCAFAMICYLVVFRFDFGMINLWRRSLRHSVDGWMPMCLAAAARLQS